MVGADDEEDEEPEEDEPPMLGSAPARTFDALTSSDNEPPAFW